MIKKTFIDNYVSNMQTNTRTSGSKMVAHVMTLTLALSELRAQTYRTPYDIIKTYSLKVLRRLRDAFYIWSIEDWLSPPPVYSTTFVPTILPKHHILQQIQPPYIPYIFPCKFSIIEITNQREVSHLIISKQCKKMHFILILTCGFELNEVLYFLLL